ncbi:MAG: T9SS type A sorting domain-containing protein [Chitinophagales bacterium]
MKKNLLLTLGAVFIIGNSIQTQAQNINTLAGTGAAAYTADGVISTSSAVNNPYGVAVDQAKNVYIADYGNNRIRKIDHTTGIITTIAGTGVGGYTLDTGSIVVAATSAMIKTPRGIAIDNAGNIYFSDYGNNRIRKINTSGIISTIAGNFDGLPAYYGDGGKADTSHVGFPWGLVVDNAGNVIFADQSNNRIRKINTSGIISTIAGTGSATYGGDGGPATLAKIQVPMGVALDAAGNIYIADDGNNRIRKINTSGIISTICGSATYGFTGDGGPASAAKLYLPQSIATDVVGNIYICDVDNNRIRKINPAGIITTLVGNGNAAYSGDGGPANLAEINQSTGVAVDTTGNIYIADNGNNRVRIINALLHAPYFIRGHNSVLTVCPGESYIDSLLSVFDIDTAQTETWSLISGPSHGIVIAAYTTPSTGGVLNTSLLKYSPVAGYFGTDSFQIRVTDGGLSDTTTIHVTVISSPNALPISGKDSLCSGPAHQITLSDATPGGVWSSFNNSIATVGAGSGVVTGIIPGSDTIYYSVTNMCGTGRAELHITVNPIAICPTYVNTLTGSKESGISLFPNPNTGTLTVNLSSNIEEEARFIITNLTGQKVKEFISNTNKSVEIQLNEPPGVYFMSAITAHGKWVAKMTIIR